VSADPYRVRRRSGTMARMSIDDEATARTALRATLGSFSAATTAAIAREIAAGVTEFRFEVDDEQGITLVESETEIVEDGVLYSALPPDVVAWAEAADVSLFEWLDEDLFPWLAACWRAASNGPACAFFHWGAAQGRRYDLVRDVWFVEAD